eukprot:TRINITY_DN5489_c0_g1_i3.p1 TRINITY_DN5489_c0_g1~~TRINITY_DN5489_c0_g1_i3.p1  ORF type:complete len:1654 (-),score=318.95 TRINITY_DN5489_c0_g1_i3:50-5011(-)
MVKPKHKRNKDHNTQEDDKDKQDAKEVPYADFIKQQIELYRPNKTGTFVVMNRYSMSVPEKRKHGKVVSPAKSILHDISLYVRPGSMVLVLGAPASGKSSIFKSLANRKDKGVQEEGEVLFNGHHIDPLTHHRDVMYVQQTDNHMPLLTVRETLDFSSRLQQCSSIDEDQRKERVNVVLKVLGLDLAADTIVGSNLVRGVSGGQRKRVTVGIEMVKGSNFGLLDEPTTGLDSTTSLEVVRAVRDLARVGRMSMLVSLLQAPQEVFELFDMLLIVSKGEQVYFGPRDKAVEYFADLEFDAPEGENPAEFLQEVADYPYKYSRDLPPKLKEAKDFAAAYKESQYYTDTLRVIDNPDELFKGVKAQDWGQWAKTQSPRPGQTQRNAQGEPIHPQDSKDKKDSEPPPNDYDRGAKKKRWGWGKKDQDHDHVQVYAASTWTQTKWNFWRAFTMTKRSLAQVRARCIKSIFMGLVLGSLFWQIDNDQLGANSRQGVVFFALTFTLFGSFVAIPGFFVERAVFYDQRASRWYKTWTYLMANIALEIPIALVESVLFGSILYWMVGLKASADAFIYFLLMLFVVDLMAQIFVRMLSIITPTVDLASTITPVVFSFFLLMCGFIVRRPVIPGWWIWMYWADPVHWAIEGLLSSELANTQYYCTPQQLLPPGDTLDGQLILNKVCPRTTGEAELRSIGFATNSWYRWIDLAIVLGYALGFLLIALVGLYKITWEPKRAAAGAPERQGPTSQRRLRNIFRRRVDEEKLRLGDVQLRSAIGMYSKHPRMPPIPPPVDLEAQQRSLREQRNQQPDQHEQQGVRVDDQLQQRQDLEEDPRLDDPTIHGYGGEDHASNEAHHLDEQAQMEVMATIQKRIDDEQEKKHEKLKQAQAAHEGEGREHSRHHHLHRHGDHSQEINPTGTEQTQGHRAPQVDVGPEKQNAPETEEATIDMPASSRVGMSGCYVSFDHLGYEVLVSSKDKKKAPQGKAKEKHAHKHRSGEQGYPEQNKKPSGHHKSNSSQGDTAAAGHKNEKQKRGKIPKPLLRDVSGYIKPGMMLALMGPSGAGKSTLLDVLANRKTGGRISGELLINGKPRDRYFNRLSGYVEQFDTLEPTQTVREALVFSAMCRLPAEVPQEEKLAFVDQVMDKLDLFPLANRPIGVGKAGLSQEQRKRVNIGVELAADPQLLFLDEPTTALDSGGAKKVITYVREIAKAGKSVICTIHQPSAVVFEMFDFLLLLTQQGEVAYFGPLGEASSVVLDYCKGLGFSTDEGRNPADFVLDFSASAKSAKKVDNAEPKISNEQAPAQRTCPATNYTSGDGEHIDPELHLPSEPVNIVEAYRQSGFFKQVKKEIAEDCFLPKDFKAPEFDSVYAATFGTQLKMNARRSWNSVFRLRLFVRAQYMRAILAFIVVGTLFWRTGTDQAGARSRISLTYYNTFLAALNAVAVLPLVMMQRPIYYRDQAAGIYRPLTYLMSMMVSFAPLITLASLLYVLPVYWIANLDPRNEAGRYFFYLADWVVLNLTEMVLLVLIGVLAPDLGTAKIIMGVCFSMFSLFTGFLLPYYAIPKWWKWFYWVGITRYPVEAMSLNQLHDLPLECKPDQYIQIPLLNGGTAPYCQFTNGNQLLDFYGYKNNLKWPDFCILIGMLLLLLFVTYLALKKVRHQKT